MRPIDAGDVTNEPRAADANLASAAASEALAQAARERQHLLFETGIAAKARVEEADANWRTAVTRRETAAAENARNKLGYTWLVAGEQGVVTAVGLIPARR